MDVGVQTRRVDADARSSSTRFASDHARRSGIEPATIWEFNGLRGIAVAAVVLYHFAPALLPGGFVGVDIFFVVSGFLIGGILWRELAATGTIQFGTFLLRRLKRLAPAYFVMAAVTTIVAFFILLPFEFREYGKSLIASVLYLSNVQFFREAGYFDTASEMKPLLHTWSLSIEEQFYLMLPILMLVLGQRTRHLPWLLGSAFLASLIACIAVTPISQTATFFLFPFRAWELLAGVLLAIAVSEKQISQRNGWFYSAVGMICIGLSLMLARSGADFPGHQALLPVFGTVLILANVRDRNVVNRLLCSLPLTSLGLISYSLYLWHWPVLTLSDYYADGLRTPASAIGWLLVSFVLAIMSWYFVERPVRQAKALPSPVLWASVAVASSILLAAGGSIYVRDGMAERYGPDIRTHIEASADFIQDWRRCRTEDTGPLVGVEVCAIGVDGKPKFLVWGDSHGRALKEGLDLAARKNGAAGLLIWRAGCPPLFGIDKQESAATALQDAECTRANAVVLQALPQLTGFESVLLLGRWSYYAEGVGTGADAFNTIRLTDGDRSGRPQAAVFADAVNETVEKLAWYFPRIYVLEQVPEVPDYDSRAVAQRLAHGSNPALEASRFQVPRADVAARTASSTQAFWSLAENDRIVLLPLLDKLCDAQWCRALREGRSIYFDNNHMTNSGAIFLSEVFSPLFAAPASQPPQLESRLHEQ